MNSKAEDGKIYEARIVADTLTRLAMRFDLKSLPFSDEELQTLAGRARESFKAPAGQKEELGRYKTHLATRYGNPFVGRVWAALEQINNDISSEEK
jgi:hypothetical protein